MARFSCTASIVASALLFLATNAAPLEPSMAPKLAEASPMMELPSFTEEPGLPMESPDIALPFASPSEDLPSESPVMEIPSPEPESINKESPVLPLTFTFNSKDTPAESPMMEMPSPSPQPINEGCVAIEHLEGYALQHAQNFKRRVLCADGFCATPNHAIIVDGVMTSMKQLCSGDWSCVETEKLVNNLNVFVNRRAQVSDRIVVTPYDIRFPEWCVWVVQAMECAWNMVCNSPILFAGIISFFVLLFQNKRKSKLE